MSEKTWKGWTKDQWDNAVYCETCGLPMLEVSDDEKGTHGHYECPYCTWMEDHQMIENDIRTRAERAEALLKERQWISIKYELPKHGAKIFVINSGSEYVEIWKYDDALRLYLTKNFTHWMPVFGPIQDESHEH
jgi:hypothetical protein